MQYNIVFNHRLFIINNCFLKSFLTVIVYRILLDIAYFYVISPLFAYQGLITDITIWKIVESYCVLAVVLMVLPRQTGKVSDAVLQLLILFAYVPVLAFYSLANGDRVWFYSVTFFWLFVIFLNKTKLRISFRFFWGGKYINWFLVISIICISFALLFLYRGFSFTFNVSLTNVYEIREEYSQIGIPFAGYIVNWAAKIIIPFVILLSLYGKTNKKSLFLLSFAIFSGFLLFSVTGHKTYLFNIPLTIGLGWLINKGNILTGIGFFFSVLISIGILLYWLADDFSFTSIITRRIFIVPAQLSFYYYDFFKEHPIFLSHSIFRYFIRYPYDLPPSNMIGSVYFNNPATNANNGIVADGFMNFGYLGLFIWAIILVALLKIVDNLVLFKNKKVLYPIIAMAFYTLVNGALLTTILTHGLFLVFIIAYLSERDNNQLGLIKSAQ